VKLRLRKHQAQVLTGEAARAFLAEHRPESVPWATAVAVCSCHWFEAAIHGEYAEMSATHHASK
jgi:hypothetical protein